MQYLFFIIDAFKAIPLEQVLGAVFLTALLLEWMGSILKNKKIYDGRDSLNNILIGLISFLFDFLFSLASYAILLFIYRHARLFTVNVGETASFVLLLVLVDFEEYWFHRLSHHINILWKAHLVHHQSTKFNLTVGLRTSLFVPMFNILFYLPFPIFGFHPDHVLLVIMLQGVYQLLLHTELVRHLGFLEKIMVTPSAHRVHHGQNERYMDRNFGKMLILWDRLFGTYIAETEPVVYGVKGESGDERPIKAIFLPILDLYQRWKHEKDRQRRKQIVFGSPREQ